MPKKVSPAPLIPVESSPHIFLFNIFNIFFDRQFGILCEQLCGQTRGGSDFCAGCGAIPKFVSKKRVFQFIRQPNGLGPTHKWEIWDFFWPTRILMKLGPRLPWGCYTMDLSSPNHLSKNSGNQVILKLFLGLGLILRFWPQWPRLHTVSQWVSAKLELDLKYFCQKTTKIVMADDLKLLVPWSFWHIPLKDRTSFQKISYLEIFWAWDPEPELLGPGDLDSTQSSSGSQPN